MGHYETDGKGALARTGRARTLVLDAGLYVSSRLQMLAVAALVLMAGQLTAASCTPEPVPYATRIGIERGY
ncbi:MAG: hypothetical protein ACK4E3_10060 [Brevundimonas sp.]|uniref:hypothetical protein n=1 Tax=Brevundimonas sp. TaxID=1871086 RepID=UPI00391D8B2D